MKQKIQDCMFFYFLYFLAGLCVIWKCSGKEKKEGVGNYLALCFFGKYKENEMK